LIYIYIILSLYFSSQYIFLLNDIILA